MIFFNGSTDLSTQNANVVGKTDENVFSNSMNGLKTESSYQSFIRTLKKIISDKMRCEVDKIAITVKSRVHDAILSTVDNQRFSKIELAIMLTLPLANA